MPRFVRARSHESERAETGRGVRPFLKISRILHAGYLLESGATSIAFDPIFENPFSRNCFAYPAVSFSFDAVRRLKLSAVFISHDHDDHFSLESLDLLDRNTPIYLYSSHVSLFLLITELGFLNVSQLSLDEPIKVGGFRVTPHLALDPDVDSVYEIEAEGLRVLNVVDSWVDPSTIERLKAHSPWDLVLWPFQTMRELEVLSPLRAAAARVGVPEEWIEQIQSLKPRFIVPSSCQFIHETWSWYNYALFPVSYREFTAQIEKAIPTCHVQRMDPSVSFILDHQSLRPCAPLTWVQLASTDIVDYDYQPLRPVPPTSDVARNFTALGDEETKRVLDYCQTELLEKFAAAGRPNDPYFETPVSWKLSLFDHLGRRTDFNYQLDANASPPIKLVEALEKPLEWLTEIPIAKFYAALTSGESLTSMYVRVNDCRFAPDVEALIESADVLEDPLIRCLFNGVVGAYQIAQLKRLRPDLRLGS